MGFSPEDAAAALDAGWLREEVVLAHGEAGGLFVTRVLPFAVLLDERWLLYRARRRPLGAIEPRLLDSEVVAYCDGSGTTFEKPAGIGVVVYDPFREPLLIAENIGLGTNNVAELKAIWRALKAVPDTRRKILIRSDSEYALGSCSEEGWRPKANVDLIAQVRQDLAIRAGRVRFEHVDGHAGVEGNEIADRLAKVGRLLVKTPSP